VEEVEEVTEVTEGTADDVNDAAEPEPTELPDPIDRTEIKYPKITVINKTADGEGPLTPDEVKEIVGYCTDPITAKVNGFSEKEPLDTLPDGTKFWFLYNTKNRPYYPAIARSYAQSILTGKWEANGESAVIGKTAECLSIQHRAGGLLIAEAERAANPETWEHLWGEGPVTMPTILVFGVEETDRVVNTMDTGKGRTGADMLFRTEIMLQAFPNKQTRRVAGNIVTNAVKMLWDRMGVKQHSFTPQLNQAELHDFLIRHPKIVEAAAHILEEDTYEGEKKRGRVSSTILPPGYAAAVLFLMGVSDTDGDEYNHVGDIDNYKKTVPTQDGMDLGKWDKAAKFWSQLVDQNNTNLSGVRQAFLLLQDKFMGRGLPEGMEPLTDDSGAVIEAEGCHPSIDEKLIVLARAWNLYKKGKPVKADDCLPEVDSVKFDKNRRRKIVGELPNFGGVDVPKVGKMSETPDDPDNTEEVEEGTEQVQRTPQEEINFMRLQFGLDDNDVALFKMGGSDLYRLWNPNSRDKELVKALGFNWNKPGEEGAFSGMHKYEFDQSKLDAVVSKAVAAGRKVHLIETFGKDKPPQHTALTGAPSKPAAGGNGAKPKVAPKK